MLSPVHTTDYVQQAFSRAVSSAILRGIDTALRAHTVKLNSREMKFLEHFANYETEIMRCSIFST